MITRQESRIMAELLNKLEQESSSRLGKPEDIKNYAKAIESLVHANYLRNKKS